MSATRTEKYVVVKKSTGAYFTGSGFNGKHLGEAKLFKGVGACHFDAKFMRVIFKDNTPMAIADIN